MANNNILNMDYRFHSNDGVLPIGMKNKGEIFIKSEQNLGFRDLTIIFQYEIKGKLNVEKRIIDSFTLDTNNNFLKGKEYRYDIDIDTYHLPSSFSGDYIQIIYSLVAEVTLDDKTKSTLRTRFLKDISFKNLFKSFEGKIKNKKRIFIKSIDPIYEIKEFSTTTTENSNTFSIIGIFLLFITAILYTQNIEGILSYIAIILGTGALLYGLYKTFSIGLLGKINLKGTALDSKLFEVDITIQKSYHKIKSVSTYYTINEEVIDDRGTSTTTYRKTIFNSSRKNSKKPISQNFQVALDYPKGDFPISFKREKVRFYTCIHIEFEFTNGLSYTLKEEFPMIRKI